MARPPSPEPAARAHDSYVVDMPAGFVMLDTGCKASVGGAIWHGALQAELKKMAVPFSSEESLEYFKFGDGATVTSTRTWVYPLALSGRCADIRIAEIPGPLPGLLSPKANGLFGLKLDFEKSRWRVPRGAWKPLQFTDSGHIRLPVLQYPTTVHVAAKTSSASEADSADEMCRSQPWLETPDASSEEGRDGPLTTTSSESRHSFSTALLTSDTADSSE